MTEGEQSTPRKKNLRNPLTTPLLREIDLRLRSYALAASATGVGLLAMAQPVDAEVVYTPTHVSLSDGQLFLHIDNGTTVNFILADTVETHSGYAFTRELEVGGSSNASVVAKAPGAAPLPPGAMIGSSRSFHKVAGTEMLLAGAFTSNYGFNSGVYGNWSKTNHAYLGLKFNISGEVHYGWVALRVFDYIHRGLHVGANVTGYAYESTPNQSIRAGQKSGSANDTGLNPDDANFDPGTLGTLALGSPGLQRWRKRLAARDRQGVQNSPEQ